MKHVLLLVVIVGMVAWAFASQNLLAEESSKKVSEDTKASKEATKTKASTNPMVVLKTNYGDITIELFKKKAPISVENFLKYVREGFYDNTVFHRVVKGFVLQAGGMTKDLVQKKQHEPIKNEATNGLSNKRGTVSMARTSAINSATSHFFINLKDNTFLDHHGEDPRSYGYAVFGKVAKGMDVADKIADVEVTTKGQMKNVPVKPVIIEKAYVLGEEPAKTKSDQKELKKEAKKIGEK